MTEIEVPFMDETHKPLLVAAVKRARARTVSAADVKRLSEPLEAMDDPLPRLHRSNKEPTRPRSENVLLLNGYRAALICEEQEAGLCLHLSLSNDATGRLPTPIDLFAVAVRCAAYEGEVSGPLVVWGEQFLMNGAVGGEAICGLFPLKRQN